MFGILAISTPGVPELILISFLAILFFGANRLPTLAEGLGQAIGKFRRAVRTSEEELKESLDLQVKDTKEEKKNSENKSLENKSES